MKKTKLLKSYDISKRNCIISYAFLHKINFTNTNFGYFLFPELIENINKSTNIDSLDIENNLLSMDFSRKNPFKNSKTEENTAYLLSFYNNSQRTIGEKIKHLGMLVIDDIVSDILESNFTTIQICSIHETRGKKLRNYYTKLFSNWDKVNYFEEKIGKRKILNGIVKLL